MTPTTGGNDTHHGHRPGPTATQTVAVNADSFTITAPAAPPYGSALGASQTVTVRWLVNGVPGQLARRSTSPPRAARVTPASAVTDGTGDGHRVGQLHQRRWRGGHGHRRHQHGAGRLEFVATTPASIDVQPSPFTIGAEPDQHHHGGGA